MEKMLPFFNMKLNNHILQIVLGFLSDTSEVANLKIISNSSRRAIEKCFMYVCTVEKDCFFNSMRLSTLSDFDLGIHEDKRFSKFKVSPVTDVNEIVQRHCGKLTKILDNLSLGAYDSYSKTIQEIKKVVSSTYGIPVGGLRNPDEKGTTIVPIDLMPIPENPWLVQNSSPESLGTPKHKVNQQKTARVHGDQKETSLLDELSEIADEIHGSLSMPGYNIVSASCSMPTILLTILDYTKELLGPITDHRNNGISYGINLHIADMIRKAMGKLFDILYKICVGNNAAKAQVFKGDGL